MNKRQPRLKNTSDPDPREPDASRPPGAANNAPSAYGAQPVPPQALNLIVAKLTDVGRARPHNEDYVDYYIPTDPQQLAQKGAIYLVADGMGGHQAGEVASQGAAEMVINQYYSDPSPDIGVSLVRAFYAANQHINGQAQIDQSKSGMGTTLVAAVIVGRKVHVANVGDSRAYLINKGGITQITEDHSWVEEQVRAGLLTTEQARRHPQRNLVTRALGSKPAVDVDLFEGAINTGDTLLLCTDGLTGRVEDHEIAAVVREYPPTEAARILVGQANERGGNDNISVLIVNAQAEPATLRMPAPLAKRPAARRSWLLPVLIGAVVLALVLGGLAAMNLLSGDGATDTPAAVTPLLTSVTTPSPEASPSGENTLLPTDNAQTAQVGTPAVTGTSTGPTATLAPTAADTPTPTPTDTATARPPTATATATPKLLPPPTLTEPAADAALRGLVTFKWKYYRSLEASEAFQVLIWKEGEQQHLGAAELWRQTEQTINLDDILPARGGPGYYNWTVVVVNRTNEKPFSREATPWRFRYVGPSTEPAPTQWVPTTEPPPLPTWPPPPEPPGP